jgi:hypothetical protein
MSDLAARMAARRAKLEAAEESGEGMYFAGPNSGGGINKKTSPGSARSTPFSSASSQPAQNNNAIKGAPASLILGDAKPTKADPPKKENVNSFANLGDVNTSIIIEQEDDEDDDDEGGASAIAKYQEELRNKDLQEQMSQYQADLKNQDAADAVVGLACGNLDEVNKIKLGALPYFKSLLLVCTVILRVYEHYTHDMHISVNLGHFHLAHV